MSANYHMTIVVGMCIDRRTLDKKLTEISEKETEATIVEKRGCEHEVPEKQKFCSECGAERVIREPQKTIELDEWQLFEQMLKLKMEQTTDGHEIVISTNHQWPSREIGRGEIETILLNTLCSPEKMLSIKEILMKKLEPYGLWNEKEFGLWAVGNCSY